MDMGMGVLRRGACGQLKGCRKWNWPFPVWGQDSKKTFPWWHILRLHLTMQGVRI